MSFHFRMRATPVPCATYEPMFPGSPETYQVNNEGMKTIYLALSVAKVLDDDGKPPNLDGTLPEWLRPERVDEIMDALQFGDELDPPATDREMDAIRQAQVAQRQLLETTSPTPGKIPAFKLGSNDGWVVAVDECATICSAIERLLADDQLRGTAALSDEARALLENWLQYVSVAMSAGGFTVH